MKRLSLLAVPALVAVVASLATAAAPQPEAVATVVVSRVTQPGLPEAISLSVSLPHNADQSVSGYLYPEDGSVVRIGSADARVVGQAGVSSSAQATTSGLAVALFGGEITIDSFDVRTSVAAGSANASGNVTEASLTGVTALGQLITPSPNAVVPLADWGSLELLGSSLTTMQKAPRSAKASVVGARVRLTADHGGLTAGSTIEIGVVSAGASAAPLDVQPVVPAKPKPAPPPTRPVPGPTAPREPGASIPGAPDELVRPAPEVTAQLSSGGYVFPVYGPASFGDTFGAFRGDVPGGWHHGEDIFAPLGTPLLAVADGAVFSVGWNNIGGWRVWLRDRLGNEFYYAHLSAYSPLAVNGRSVNAGDVLGFMGKTGDAEFTPPHLHFEIHPVALLALGYDGAVAPYPFLNAWRRAQDVSFDAGRAYLPLDGPASARRGLAPPAGAVLLEQSDISAASGLTPGALEATLTGRASTGSTGGKDR